GGSSRGPQCVRTRRKKRGRARSSLPGRSPGGEMGRQPVESTLALLSSANRTGRWQAKGVTQATALLGACTIDLRDAEIEGDQLLVKASAVMGSIHIVVSEHTDVDLTGTALLGSIKDQRKSADVSS